MHKVIVTGFSPHSDTLRLSMQKLQKLPAFRLYDVLSIEGVSHFWKQHINLGVGLNCFAGDDASKIRIASLTLVVVCGSLGIQVSECSLVHEESLPADDQPDYAARIHAESVICFAPAPVNPSDVKPRGTAPAYWLREPA